MTFEGRIDEGAHRLYINGVVQITRESESPFGETVEWGHNGRAAAQLAYLILRRFGRKTPVMQQVHRFKREIIAQQCYDRSFVINGTAIACWLKEDWKAAQAA